MNDRRPSTSSSRRPTSAGPSRWCASILNQIGRRLTEELHAKGDGVTGSCSMLDEFPALGRLDFFESALAFMAGYGLKSFLIAQSLNQIEKAYGPNNCHPRQLSCARLLRHQRRADCQARLGCPWHRDRDSRCQELCGSQAEPWLGHLMVSRQETARPLLTPGEVMQLPATDELVLVSGCPPIRAKKARYHEDARFKERILRPPALVAAVEGRHDDWTSLPLPSRPQIAEATSAPSSADEDQTDPERRRQPELSRVELVVKPSTENEFEIDHLDDVEDSVARNRRLTRHMQGIARQASLDPGDGVDM